MIIYFNFIMYNLYKVKIIIKFLWETTWHKVNIIWQCNLTSFVGPQSTKTTFILNHSSLFMDYPYMITQCLHIHMYLSKRRKCRFHLCLAKTYLRGIDHSRFNEEWCLLMASNFSSKKWSNLQLPLKISQHYNKQENL